MITPTKHVHEESGITFKYDAEKQTVTLFTFYGQDAFHFEDSDVETIKKVSKAFLEIAEHIEKGKPKEAKKTKGKFKSWHTCKKCGEKELGKLTAGGITVMMGDCPDCGKEEVTLIPLSDFPENYVFD